MIALVDCNNFFVSCERVFYPKINNKPVVILSNNDGCIISRSNEAKNLGLKMGEPFFKKRDFIKENKVHVFSTNLTLYNDFSNRVMSILLDLNSKVEIYSIDEAFIDFSKKNDHLKYAHKLKHKIKKWTGIPVSIGIANNKTLAKMANMIAKKNIFEGIFKIDDIDKHNMLLKDFPVSNIWGIGEKYTNKLNSFGINFAYQLMECNDSWLKTNFPLTMLRTVLELRGEPGFDLKANDRMKRSITVSRTFPTRIDSFEDLVKNISNYAAICGYKLRKQKSFATIMKVFVYGKNFENKMNKEVRKIYFNIATNDSFEIISKSIAALRDIYKADYTYKKGGVVLYNISPCNKLQLNCFDHDDILIRENIMNVVDGLNDKFGRSKVYFGINGRGARYRACQSFSSPHYTTNINELFKVHC